MAPVIVKDTVSHVLFPWKSQRVEGTPSIITCLNKQIWPHRGKECSMKQNRNIQTWQKSQLEDEESEPTLNGSQPGDECGTAGRRGAGAMEATPLVHGRRRLHCDLVLKVCRMWHEQTNGCKKKSYFNHSICRIFKDRCALVWITTEEIAHNL